jgi:hypothetical protein
MSNYLDNLAARSLGQIDQVWPRLPSFFEIPISGPISSLDHDGRQDAKAAEFAETEEPVDSTRAAISPDRAIAREPRVSVAAADMPPTQGESDERKGLGSPQGPFRVDDIRITADRPPPTATDSGAGGIDADQGSTQKNPALPGFPKVQGTARPEHAPVREIHLAGEVPRADAHTPGRETEAHEGHQEARHPAVGLETGPAVLELERLAPRPDATDLEAETPAPIRSRQAASPYDEKSVSIASRVALPRLSQTEPQSTIKVTIGRVEVRALFNDARPARQENTKVKPRITLDEYLKQRNGGQR